jgi:hypothetical protein
MEVSMEASRNGVNFRRPTFKNPLPKMFKALGKGFLAVFIGIIAFGESAGRARAAAELSRQGYHAEARRLMLREDEV